MRSWRRRTATVVGAWVVGYAVLSLAGFRVQPVLTAALVLALAGATYLVYDLGDTVTAGSWEVGYPGRTFQGGSDQRAARLRRWLEVSSTGGATRPVVHDALVEVVADVLQHRDGIDLQSDREAATAVLGPQLSAFVYDPDAAEHRLLPRQLAEVVGGIEQLVARP